MIASTSLLKSLTTPTKLANRFDWRKMTGSAVLSLDIHADRIGIALAGHPSSSTMMASTSSAADASPVHVESLPLERRGKVSSECKQRLQDLVHSHNVCGFVVSWPVQKDTGRMGASCGRTLYTLEQLLGDTASATATSSATSSQPQQPVISPSRPVCLWDPVHSTENQPQVDSFGRSVAYSLTEPTGRVEHVASQEQYHQDQQSVYTASQVWDDFARQFWPNEYNEQQQQQDEHRSVYQEPEYNHQSSSSCLAAA